MMDYIYNVLGRITFACLVGLILFGIYILISYLFRKLRNLIIYRCPFKHEWVHSNTYYGGFHDVRDYVFTCRKCGKRKYTKVYIPKQQECEDGE